MKLNKEIQEKMVLNILSEISKVEGKEFAEQSLKIIDNQQDNAILTGVLMNKAKPSVFSEEQQLLSDSLIEIVGCFFYQANNDGLVNLIEDGFSKKLVDAFNIDFKITQDEDSYFDSLHKKMKIKFAMSQFALAFMEYERMEQQYPKVMNFMDEI